MWQKIFWIVLALLLVLFFMERSDAEIFSACGSVSLEKMKEQLRECEGRNLKLKEQMREADQDFDAIVKMLEGNFFNPKQKEHIRVKFSKIIGVAKRRLDENQERLEFASSLQEADQIEHNLLYVAKTQYEVAGANNFILEMKNILEEGNFEEFDYILSQLDYPLVE